MKHAGQFFMRAFPFMALVYLYVSDTFDWAVFYDDDSTCFDSANMAKEQNLMF